MTTRWPRWPVSGARAGDEADLTAIATDSIETLLGALPGRPAHRPVVARDAVSLPAIRSWCDAIGERNPLFTDRAAARAAGHPDVIAPPATLQMWTMPGLEPGRPPDAGPATAGDLDLVVRGRLAELGYPATLAVATDQTFCQDLVPGDVVCAQDRYTTVSDRKATTLGPGYFVSSATQYRTAAGALVGRLTLTVFHYRPGPTERPARPRRPAAEPPTTSRSDRLGRRRVGLTPTSVIAGALATRDYYPVHHDRDFARAHGHPDILVNILTTNGLLARVVGEWTGGARLLGLTTRLRQPAHPYDELTFDGSIADVDGEQNVDAEQAELVIRVGVGERGLHAEARARVAGPPQP
ncbi:MAG TPA: MaoC family dehydratase N-terminal domain-containing protein [Acidimicrobiales bacterium]